MVVKFNGNLSTQRKLIGGGPQGTLIGQTEYIVASDDCLSEIPTEEKFKYIDDLSVLELILLSEHLVDYDFKSHVASDFGIGHKFLPPSSFNMQINLNEISRWTDANLMKLNVEKSNYIVFSRSKTAFNTRLQLNGKNLEELSVTKLLGVWLSEDLNWEKNTKEICKKAYSRVTMLSKLKYIGLPIEDLIKIYILFIRSLTEYCSVVFHGSLTQELTRKIEQIQKTCLKVILSENYVSYEAALEMSGLETLHDRRESRCLSFAQKCVKNTENRKMFPTNDVPTYNVRQTEKYVVNFARTNTYFKSAIPFCQRKLNEASTI